MRSRTPIYYITACFVIGMIVLLVVQTITSIRLKELIASNEQVLSGYKLTNRLITLQKDLLLLDNKIKTAIISGDSGKIKDFEFVSNKIKEDVELLQESSDINTSLTDVKELRRLVGQKIDFSHQLADNFYKAGKPGIDSLLVNKQNSRLSAAITILTHKIDTSGRALLAEKIQLVDQGGQSVITWHRYISILVFILLTTVFVIVIIRMRTQSELIGLLNTSEKKLKEAAMVKENFLANMSHEIRTPLNAILGYSGLLEKERLGETARLYLATVRQSGETLLSIVNDILDLSKIESGLMRIESVPFSISGLLHSVSAMFYPKIHKKGLSFKTDLSQDIPDILMGDATRLTQILVNLIGNAIKFTGHGEISLRVREKNKSSSDVEIEFVVSDTGIGIAPEKLGTIFERFWQAEDSTTREFGGTGLGLSIVRDLIHLQNGSIALQSKPNFGTQVSFILSYPVARHPHIPVHYEQFWGDPAFDKGQKILIAEDNVINQGLVVQILKGLDITTHVANNGKEAVAMLSGEHFDLVFMDIQMPEMDGYMAATQIRQKLKLDVPIVAMTAHAMAGEREKCIGLGMNEHISKPIRETDLKRVLSIFLKSNFSKREDLDPPNRNESEFKIIDLEYMREISSGDVVYEKLVTRQFLDLVPIETAALWTAFSNQDFSEIKRTVHRMQATISIMGLDALLNKDLQVLEHEDLSVVEIEEKVFYIISVCNQAVSEANVFYSYF